MRTFLIIFKKEFTDTVRDRRTLFVMVIFPLLLFPILITAITRIQSSQMKKAEEKVLVIGVATHSHAASFVRFLKETEEFSVVEGIPPDSAQSLVMADSLDAAIVFAPDFSRSVEHQKAGTVQLFYKLSDEYNIAQRRLKNALDKYEKSLVAARFTTLGLDASITEAIRVEEHDVTPMKEMIGKTVGGFIPYLFIIFCLLGSTYPAIDLAAGEKERGTIETLLTAPVGRFHILLGKFSVVVLAGILSAGVSMLGLYVAVRQSREIPGPMMDALMSILEVDTVLLVLSLLLPLAMFFAALLLSLSFFARSYKEAQSIISPLTIVVIVPVAIGMIPGIILTAWTALIPVLNVSLATKEIIAGTIAPGLLAEVYASLMMLAGLSLWGCSKWVEREETIFRGT